MADYIEPVKIEELPDKESLEDSDFFIAEDSEDTKKLTFEVLKKYVNDTVTIYFGLSSDAWKAPTHDITESAILGQGILGQMLLGDSAEWNTEFPTALNHDDYIWVSFYVEHPNGETEWTTPFCLMDQDAKETIIEIQKELETAQADILKNSGLIAENSELLEEVSEKAAENTEQIEELSEKVNANADSIAENKEAISANADKITEIEKSLEDTDKDVSKLDERVTSAETSIESDGEDIQFLKDTIEDQTAKIEELKSELASKSNELLTADYSYSRTLDEESMIAEQIFTNIQIDGYRIIGILNSRVNYVADILYSLYFDSSNNLYLEAYNQGDSSREATIYFTILYVKE